MAGRTGKTHKEVLARALTDDETRREYEALKPEFEMRRALVYLRQSMNLTQKELAEMVNTKQEYISRVERGRVEISMPYLVKLLNALGADMEIILKPKNGEEPIKAHVSLNK